MKKIIAVGVAVALAMCASAEVKTAPPFADGMVLQRGRAVPVWGTAEPGEIVAVSFAGQAKTAKAGEDGKWRVDLDAMEASRENRTMTVTGAANAEEIKDVLVGEVWFASGQSNMECPIWGNNPRYRDGKGGIMTQMIHRPSIRYTVTGKKQTAEPRLGWKAKWREFSPQSFRAQALSAVAFYYALDIYGELEIPVGIIEASWGGSRIEPWIPLAPGEEQKPLEENARARFGQAHTMFNGMVAAYAPYAMRGMIWYQGCSNVGDGLRYAPKLRSLYDGWKREFENPGLKMYLAELAPFANNFYGVRLAQAKFAAEEPNAALAVTCDAGNLADIHPNDKEIVAKRLALHALKRDYGFTDIIDDSPFLDTWRVEDGRFILRLKDAKKMYIYRPDKTIGSLGFEIAGPDGRFVEAKLLNKVDGHGIVGEELVIAADGVDKPQLLRYLATSPWTGAIYSYDSGLPIGCFEIDARTVEAGGTQSPASGAVATSAPLPLLAGFRKIIVADIPAGKNINAVGYSFDVSPEAGTFSRVAYKMELERNDGSVDWVVVAMDAFTNDAAKLGVPSIGGGWFQQKVANLSVRSNVAGVEDRDGGEGAIEFFNKNYAPKKGASDWPGDDAKYDINDSPLSTGNYGSMQVHDLASGKTVFAYNGFNGSNPDIGIGSNPGANPDWTFAKNTGLYKSRRLTILVK